MPAPDVVPDTWRLRAKCQTGGTNWCATVPAHHPDVLFRVLEWGPGPGGSVVEDIDVSGAGWRAAVDEIHKVHGADDVDVISVRGDGAVVRVAAQGCVFPSLLARAQVTPQFPSRVDATGETWQVRGPRDRLHRLLDAMDAEDRHPVVESLLGPRADGALTARQLRVLRLAYERGFFEFPRGISLTALAAAVGVSKAALAETLRAAERAAIVRLARTEGWRAPAHTTRRR